MTALLLVLVMVLVSITLLSVCNRLFATRIRYSAIPESVSAQREEKDDDVEEKEGGGGGGGGVVCEKWLLV